MSTYETTQPWVVYHYGLTHDKWWPLWTSTRVLGRSRIECECAVCGDRTVVTMRIPRFGKIPTWPDGRHPERVAYLEAHAHPERGAPMSWKRPLLNVDAMPSGLDLDALAMRIEADLNELP
jgi:hypothetical protein